MKILISTFFISSLVVLFFIGCSEILSPVSQEADPGLPASAIKIEQLEAHNISENMSVFSTHNDEIVLLTYLMEKQENGVRIIEEKMFKDMIFDSTKTIHYLDLSFYPEKNKLESSIATFVLVELDETNSESSIQDKFRTELVNGIFLEEIEREKLDSMIGDDDFLGLKYLEMKDLSKGKETDITFRGMYLFDRYNYTLQCKGL